MAGASGAVRRTAASSSRVVRKPDPTDRRAILICLTERGWDEIREALRIIAELEEEWADRLGEDRIEQLRGSLAELGARAEPAPE